MDGVKAFSDGVVVVSKSGKEGLVDAAGKALTRIKYDRIYSFRKNMPDQVKTEKKQWGFIDKQGEEVIKPVYEDAFPFEAGQARIKKDGKWGYIDSTGKLLIPMQFDFVFDFDKKTNVAIAARNMVLLI